MQKPWKCIALVGGSNGPPAQRRPHDASRDDPHKPMPLIANPHTAIAVLLHEVSEYMQHICGKTHLLIPIKVVHVCLVKTGEVLHLALDIHGEGTSVHLHPAATIMSEREDAGRGVLCVIAGGVLLHLPAVQQPLHASSPTTRHSTPANIEDLAAILYEMRENQDEHYRQTDKQLAHLEGDPPQHQNVVSARGRTTQSRGVSMGARRRR